MVQLQTKTCQDYCLDVAEKIQARLGTDVQHEHGMSFSSMMSRYSQTLPSDSNLENDGTIIDLSSKNALQAMNSINWWAMPCPQFYPLNCPNSKNVAKLCHSASISMWGINDCILADTMRKALTDDEKNGKKLFNRWVAVNNFELQTDQVKLSRWEKIIQAVTDNDLPTDHFHIFLLANILRRPILVLSKDNMNGFYFPSLWPESFVIRSPLVTGRTSDFIPLISHKPESGRDFIPVEDAQGERFPIWCLTDAERVDLDALSSKYMDIQQQPVLVNHNLVNLQLANLNCIEMTYDMCVIDQYLDRTSGTQVDMETYIVSDRWSQLAIGFPPIDWYLPRQVSLFSSDENHHIEQEHENPEDSEMTAVRSASSNEDFFARQTVDSTDSIDAPREAPEITSKRAMFKRRATLSELGPAFGGRRGAMIGGKLDDSSMDASTPMRKPGPFIARPGLGSRIRAQRRRSSLPAVDTISEEGTDPVNSFAIKLKKKYNAPDQVEQHQGFIGDRPAMRSMLSRRASLSDMLPQYHPH